MGIKATIVVLGGDGIGPEVTREGVRVLQAIAARFGHDFKFADAPHRRRCDRRNADRAASADAVRVRHG